MSSTPSRPVFLLGAGCQKGGTAWLHDYLSSSPEADFGFMKEYHVWDRLDLQENRPGLKRMLKRGHDALDSIVGESRGGDVRALRQATFMLDEQSYFDYFASLTGPGRARLTGDITPAYAGLAAPRLTRIRDELDRRGLEPRVLMSLRDPVGRLWSAVRMLQMRQPEQYPGTSASWLEHLLDSDWARVRSRYDLTLAELTSVFGAERMQVVLFERLFEPATLRALTADLGIGYVEPALDTRRNETTRTEETLPDELVARVAQHFRPVYDYVDQHLPHLDARASWPSYAAL